jgi:pimeloyl-ACP methyl ester carboxylesterase
VVEVVSHRARRWPWIVVALAVVAASVTTVVVVSARTPKKPAPPPFDLRTVGKPCSDDPAWTCGSIRRLFDRTSPGAGSIDIHFRVLPRLHTRTASAGTIVVVNGGPGQSATQQHHAAEKAFRSLRPDRDLLLVDNRGTGLSGAVNCPRLQRTISLAGKVQCRKILGARIHDYTTVAAADDLEAVLERMRTQNVDIYAESYGTFFAQVFALHHPQRLQRLVLDGALPLDADPWSRARLPAGLADLRAACRADPACNAYGDPVAQIAAKLAVFRNGIPPNGISRKANDVALLLMGAGHAGNAYRELPASLRADRSGDPIPLLRLLKLAEAGGFGDSSATNDSAGLQLATTCADFPQAIDLHAPVTSQADQLDTELQKIAASDPGAFLPFTPQEALVEQASECLGWPPPTEHLPYETRARFPRAPTLILEGGLDTVTPPAGARAVGREFPDSHYVTVPFVGHVTAFRDSTGCAAHIAANFLASGGVDTSCTAHIPVPVQIDAFPKDFANETPIRASDGRTAVGLSSNDLRSLAVARDAVADVLWLWGPVHLFSGRGLRGGTFATQHSPSSSQFSVHLEGIRWTNDTTVSGDLTTSRDFALTGDIVVDTPAGGASLEVSAKHIDSPTAVEHITGEIGADKVDVTVAANLGL